MNASVASRKRSEPKAIRLRRKRCQARAAGEEAAGAIATGRTSLITHAPVEPAVAEVHQQIQDEQQRSIEQSQPDHHGVITIEKTVHEKHADARNAKDALDHKRA